jgi:hypothetical protein
MVERQHHFGQLKKPNGSIISTPLNKLDSLGIEFLHKEEEVLRESQRLPSITTWPSGMSYEVIYLKIHEHAIRTT